MKKIVKIILTFLFVFILISCNEEKVDKMEDGKCY